MIKRLFFISIFCLFLAVSAYAEDLYYASAGAGSQDGSDCDNAILYSSITYGGGEGSIDAGDTLHICGTITLGAGGGPVFDIGVSGSNGNEVTIKFEDNAILEAPYFDDLLGAIKITNYDYIIIDGGTNGIIRNTNNGGDLTYQMKSYLIILNNADNITIKNLTLSKAYDAKDDESEDTSTAIESGSDSYVRSIDATNCDELRIHDCTLNSSGWTIAATGTTPSGLYIYNNTISDFSTAATISTSNTYTTVEIYDNTISDNTQWAYNDGIKFFGELYDDSFSGVKIYNNRFDNCCDGSTNGSTAYILVDQARYDTPQIFNNVLVGGVNDNCANGWITVGNHTSEPSARAVNSRIFNNTIIKANTSSDIIILLTKKSTGHQVYNNILSSVASSIFSLNDVDTTVTSDYNDLYLSSGTLTLWGETGLTDACNNASQECNSIGTDPSLDANYKPDSEDDPPVDAGTSDVSGVLTDDKDGTSRPQISGWDIGAYEYGGFTMRGVSLSKLINLAILTD